MSFMLLWLDSRDIIFLICLSVNPSIGSSVCLSIHNQGLCISAQTHFMLVTDDHDIAMTSHEHHVISNYYLLDCLFNSLFIITTNKSWKLLITVPLWGDSTGDQWIFLTLCQLWEITAVKMVLISNISFLVLILCTCSFYQNKVVGWGGGGGVYWNYPFNKPAV